MKKVLLVLFLLVSGCVFSQDLDFSPYLSNVVDIGGGNFGIITANIDDHTISFVTVIYNGEPIYDGISVKFFNTTFESTGYIVEEFSINNYILVLYTCTKPNTLSWREESYEPNRHNIEGIFSTFLDNGKSDNQWSTFREKISFVSQLEEVLKLNMSNMSSFNRGMPVFNSNGSIMGIIATKPTSDDINFFDALNFSAIEKMLYKFGKCKYFQLKRFGSKYTLCEEEKNRFKLAEKNDRKIQRQNKIFNFTVSPSIIPHVYIQSSELEETSYSGVGYSAGLNLYFWPDSRKRLVFKPRYGKHIIIPPSDSNPIVVNNRRLLGVNFSYFEMPIMFETNKSYGVKYNNVMAIGYIPSFPFKNSMMFDLTNDPTATIISDQPKIAQTIKSKSAMVHKIMIELTFENKISRWGFFYYLQLNGFLDPSFTISSSSGAVAPFQGQDRLSHCFGAEFSWRLWGNWLLKDQKQ